MTEKAIAVKIEPEGLENIMQKVKKMSALATELNALIEEINRDKIGINAQIIPEGLAEKIDRLTSAVEMLTGQKEYVTRDNLQELIQTTVQKAIDDIREELKSELSSMFEPPVDSDYEY